MSIFRQCTRLHTGSLGPQPQHLVLNTIRSNIKPVFLKCPKHVEIFMLINHNCCIKLVPLVILINYLSSSLLMVLCLHEVTQAHPHCCGLTTKFVSIRGLRRAVVTLTNIDIATSIEHRENTLALSKLCNTV